MKVGPNLDDSFAHEAHVSLMKTGYAEQVEQAVTNGFNHSDLIAFSGIGTLPALTMMFSDAPISSVGILVRIPNKWTQEVELFVAEFTRNTERFVDAVSGSCGPGLRLFRFVERLYQFNGSSIFWCPLKTVSSTPGALTPLTLGETGPHSRGRSKVD